MTGDAKPGVAAETAATPREIERWMYQFTAQLAHDMRAPMGAIFMWAHVLRAAEKGDLGAAIDAIETSARQQSRMLGDLVDMTRAVVGRLPLDRGAVDLGTLVQAAVDEKAKDATVRRVVVDCPLAPSPSSAGALVIRADPKRVQQALACVIIHAIATTAGGGRVELRLSRQGDDAEVRIRMPLGGIEDGAVADLFTPYRAVGLDLTAARPDFGMGLAFARSVARLHAGSLEVENEGPEASFTFSLRIPLARESY
jgi:signal transduction histidine kinase